MKNAEKANKLKNRLKTKIHEAILLNRMSC